MAIRNQSDPPGVVERVRSTASQIEQRYAPDEHRPLGGYLSALAAYGVASGLLVLLARRRGVEPPDHLSAADLALISVATHKLSRTLAKDAVTSPIRAPFTRYEQPAGSGELNEEVTATGAMHGIGELLSCPFCLAQWVATGFVAGLVFAPRMTRLVAGVFCARSGSDVLQFAYARIESSEAPQR